MKNKASVMLLPTGVNNRNGLKGYRFLSAMSVSQRCLMKH